MPEESNVVILLAGLWGWIVSWMEERFGAFENLSPRWKQLVNSVLSLVVPLAAGLLAPHWRDSFGDLGGFTNEFLLVLALPAAWLASQLWHYADKLLKKWAA